MIYASIIFLLVVVAAFITQHRTYKRAQDAERVFDDKVASLIPRVQDRHRAKYGRASTALESSFPGQTAPPPFSRGNKAS